MRGGKILVKCLNMMYMLPEELKKEITKRLNAYGIEVIHSELQRWYTEDELIEKLKGIDATLAGGEIYSSKVINSTNKLKIIARVGVGYDNVDLDAATKKGIVVTTTPVPELAKAVAEEAITLMLAVLRKITFFDKMMRKGIYYTENYYSLVKEAFPLTAGIIGLGRIGKQFAKRAIDLEMKVQYYDIVRKYDAEEELGVKFVNFEELLMTSDVITIHVPLNPRTRGMIGEKELKMMKKSAILINTARGAIVDERALYKALKDKQIGGAGISVYTQEPVKEGHPFYKIGDELENLILLPHVGDGPYSVKAQVCAAVNDIIAVIEGRKPRYILNKEVLSYIKLKDK
jgi:glyoxylate reductase